MQDATFLLLFMIATFVAAGLVKGVTGLGLPTVAMGLLGLVMSPASAAALMVLPSFVTNIWQLITGPALSTLVYRLWLMLVCLFLSTIMGSWLLIRADPAWSSFWLGITLVVYAIYAFFAPELTVSPKWERWLAPLIGAITGVVTGTTGVFVMPVLPYLASLNLSREEFVQALGLSFTVSTLALALGLFAHGAFDTSRWGLSALAIVPALTGLWMGQWLRHRISPARFRHCFLVLLAVLGLELIRRPFM